MVDRLITMWPGKSSLTDGGPMHPAAYHMLDVAAVAERLLVHSTLEPVTRALIVALTALHDLGKIGACFRRKIVDGCDQGPDLHWHVTEALLCDYDDFIAARIAGRGQRRLALYAASAGHHGRPPMADHQARQRMLAQAGPDAVADAGAMLRFVLDAWPAASLERVERAAALALSWWLPGFIAAADWIGSNAAWFPPEPPTRSLPEYLVLARQRAGLAVEAAGLWSPAPATMQPFTFPLRPMQLACRDIPLTEGPMLAVIEDETGAGKTEAALILAQRMMAGGKGRGLYFALPTMATADAMFLRLRDVAGRLFEAGPSLTLAHGRAGLSVPFRDLAGADRQNPDDPGCADWLRLDRRRALLADVGVGTIDQALLAILPVRHACLRLYGLSSKILIVDEVHEVGEPYMAELVAALLHAHAALGGSAILLTATLPLALRARLLAAFENGAGRDAAPALDPAYPALTVGGGAARTDLPQAAGARGAVRVERLPDVEAAVALIRGAAARGAACLWVRNAVDDAIAAVDALRAAGVAADLLHARFALVDRKRHEAAALAALGKVGQERAGRVLVATQVVESSLDLDADLMVSDLAPMASLIQRAGRLWRHMDLRPAVARPVPGPVLYVLSPALVDGAREGWLRETLGAGAHVYPSALLWRTARVLFETGRIEAPADLRRLIETAHGEDVALPPGLDSADARDFGARKAKAGQGARNVVDWAAGYRAGAGDWQDAEFPTRMGQPTRRLMLARRVAGRLVPWADAGSRAEGELLSEVTASVARLSRVSLPDQEAPDVAAAKDGWPKWLKDAVTVCPVDEAGRICEGLSYHAEVGLIFADR